MFFQESTLLAAWLYNNACAIYGTKEPEEIFMRRQLLSCVLAVFAAFLLLSCASRNDVCKACIDRTNERLIDAAAGLYPDAIKRLLDEGAYINAKDSYGETPLMKALRQPPSRSLESVRPMEATVEVLLNAGANIRTTSKHNVKTLKLVQETDNVAVIRLFNSRLKPSERNQMFMNALAAHQYDVGLYLLQAGANSARVNEKNQSALHLAVSNPQPHPELVSLLLKTGDVNLMDDYGTTPVMAACANGAPVEVVRQLIDSGSDTSIRFNGKTLLFLALTAEKENVDLVKYLLDHGFNPNETDQNGVPLLVLMAKADRIRSAKALTDAGADVLVLDNYGESAYRYRLNILAT
jgi:ankyrin repeat protein